VSYAYHFEKWKIYSWSEPAAQAPDATISPRPKHDLCATCLRKDPERPRGRSVWAVEFSTHWYEKPALIFQLQNKGGISAPAARRRPEEEMIAQYSTDVEECGKALRARRGWTEQMIRSVRAASVRKPGNGNKVQ